MLLTNLPTPVSSFIGREPEPAEVRRLLAVSRLVTLTGAGRALDPARADREARPEMDPARPVDRWGGTPLSDADGNGHTEIAALLREHAEEAAPLSRSGQREAAG
jgi:ankyrin repeat protein